MSPNPKTNVILGKILNAIPAEVHTNARLVHFLRGIQHRTGAPTQSKEVVGRIKGGKTGKEVKLYSQRM